MSRVGEARVRLLRVEQDNVPVAECVLSATAMTGAVGHLRMEFDLVRTAKTFEGNKRNQRVCVCITMRLSGGSLAVLRYMEQILSQVGGGGWNG